MKKFFLIAILNFVLLTLNCFAQNKNIDSLLNVLKTVQVDTAKVNTLNLLSRQYINSGNYNQTILYGQQALQLAEKRDYKKGLANAYNNVGVANWYNDKYEKALENHLKALKIRETIGDKQGIGNSYNNIGLVYLNQGNYEKCLENYVKALKIREKIGDKNGTASSYNNIGVVFLKQSNYQKALENYLKALKIREEIGDKLGLGMSYNNIGLIYLKQGNYKKALDNLLKGLKTREEVGDKKGIADSFVNIGNIYFTHENYKKALEYNIKASKINEKIGNKRGVGASLINIANCYMKQNKIKETFYYLNRGLKIVKEIGNKDGIIEAYSSFSDLYEKKGDYKLAYIYHKFYSDLKDTLLNEQSGKQIAETNTKYESEKKEKDIELLTKTKELQVAEVYKQKIIRNVFIAGLVLALLLAFIIYNRFIIKQKLNSSLSNKNNELLQKNILIEQQKGKIIDSITYAQRIQESILMEESEVQNYLPDSFIYYQPKDIVSGDFYWCSKIDDKIILAAIDCTGHGVPGAFMSMIGNTLLNQIVNEKHITTPSEIVRLLNIGVYKALHQEKSDALSRDGMDVALCCIDYKNNEVQFAGAQNPMYVVSDNEVTVIKADMQTVGGGGLIPNKGDAMKIKYTNHIIPIKKDMSIYLFTDGYMDQFGGSNRKKFGIQKFKELLVSNQHLSMQKQKEIIVNAQMEWKENMPQVDDILVIGVKI